MRTRQCMGCAWENQESPFSRDGLHCQVCINGMAVATLRIQSKLSGEEYEVPENDCFG